MQPEWRSNYTMEMNGDVMRWRFTPEKHIQVEQYPPLTMSRTSDWGWRMENAFVVFLSLPLEPKNSEKNRKDGVTVDDGSLSVSVPH